MRKFTQSLIVRLIVLAVIIFGVSGWLWWHYVCSNPERVFSRMLNTMLTTTSVTKEIVQSDGTSSLQEKIQLTTSPVAQLHSRNVLDQGSVAVVTTEGVGTLSADYVRYNEIKTSQKSASGKDFDFSSVINHWGSSTDENSDENSGHSFGQALLGIIPVANLPKHSRAELIKVIQDKSVYKVDYAQVKRQNQNGRPVYTYDVTVDAVAYMTMLKEYAKAIGYKNTELEQMDPSLYAGSPPMRFDFQVDVWSAQLIEVTFRDADAEEPRRIERYSAYGAQVVVPVPQKSIRVEELQDRLQKIQ